MLYLGFHKYQVKILYPNPRQVSMVIATANILAGYEAIVVPYRMGTTAATRALCLAVRWGGGGSEGSGGVI